MDVVDVAMYFERQHPSRRWYKFLPHGPPEPMFDDSKRDAEPIKHPPMNPKVRLPGASDHRPEDYRDPEPRPV